MAQFLATLVRPTYTSELYEWTSEDLGTLFTTRLFGDAAEAEAWAQAVVDEDNLETDEDEKATKVFERNDLDGSRHIWWSQANDVEDSSVEDTFYLRIWAV